jgi:hypothetical protein
MQDLLLEQVSKVSVKPSSQNALTSLLRFIYTYALRNKTNWVELLYLLRPILYLSSMIYFGKKSIYPLIVSIIIDAITMKVQKSHSTFTESKIYYSEMMYRMNGLGTYLLREPIFSIITKPFIHKLLRILRLPQSLVDLALEMLTYYTNIYFIL